ncbi:MAG: hypothetical protein WAM21_08040 [Steroidobacteraceae bacterium]
MDDKSIPAEKLRVAIEHAGFKPGAEEFEREWAFGRLSGAFTVYLWESGRDPDTPEGERRLRAEALRKARAEGSFQYADEEPDPAPTEGKHLTGLIKAAKALREHWLALPSEIQMAVDLSPLKILEHPNGAVEFLPVDPLQDIIEKAEQIKKERTGGRPKDQALEHLLKVIVWVWWCAFVTDPRDSPRAGITYSGNAANDADRYGGPLLEFACDVLKSHDVPCVRSALGRRLHVFVTQTWQMSRRENPPAKAN